MARVPVKDGPADGATVTRRGYYTWLSPWGKHLLESAPRAALYRLEGDPREHYVYCEREITRCTGCGGFHQRGPEECTFCGAPLARRGAASTDR